ncbi:hypothetical protein A2442_00440 [Candidatus Campbellbacteria bacterium RIFOXYC2_FULL_35_25]|uniref:L,D-TPase catalytic domain-containing protein n=1 Tax=Candidatus Campbellbacteria bacterium RIFOXYC2_FULL_35_25 TaxID=1797582 RepID=A0A1F5EI22_9BACT|nr:MAG: hypothetical protein A2442_00440 [Candidatus Campbellbacteria bacterium RIFOXYC2_FULL_35_25]
MFVTQKHHRNTIIIFSGVLFILLFFIILILFKPNLLSEQETSSLQEYIDDPSSKYLEAPANPFLHEEEVVVEITSEKILPIKKVLFEYVEVIDGCGPHFEEECLNVRSGPGVEYPVVSRLRNGIVLKVGGKVENEGQVWYKIIFDEWLRYPERVKGNWYVSADHVRVLLDEGIRTIYDEENSAATTTKKIIVDRSSQTLYAYDGDILFMTEKISTGLELTPTPRGEFTIFRKTPSRYMQGPIPNIANQYYDLPGVPWNLYFTHGGAVIHGAYWHTSFGKEYSHGCVNLWPEKAQELYNWAELGTLVIVKD